MFQLDGRGRISAIILGGSLLATLGLGTAPAQAATTATATSNPTTGMRYTGTAANNHIGITLKGASFTIDDVVPITAGVGCAPVAGDATKVTCAAPTDASGKLLRFTVIGGDGRDTIVNQTTVGTVAGAPMLAFGGDGLDALFGASLARDELHGDNDGDVLLGGEVAGGANSDDQLYGGAGNDALKGGQGNDRLSGGPGRDNLDGEAGADVLDGGADADTLNGGTIDNNWDRDTVDYSSRTTKVTVDLTDAVATGQGEQNENDTITRVEVIRGGSGDDSLTGDAGPNRIEGGDGNDFLFGMAGLDVLQGGRGNDTLVPSPMVGIFVITPDGRKDVLDGGETFTQEHDVAWRSKADGDLVSDVETVYAQ